MSEVSSQVCLPLVDQVAVRGLTPDRLLEGLPFTVNDLRSGMRVRWDHFTILLERVRQALNGFEQVRIVPDQGGMALLRALAEAASGPKEIYRAGFGWLGPSLFSSMRVRSSDLADGRLRVTVEILPNYRDCPPFFELLNVVLRRLPALVRQSEARVEMELAPRRAIYTIEMPPPLSRRQRLLRLLRGSDGEKLVAEATRELQEREREQGRMRQETERLRQQLVANASQLEALDRLAQRLPGQLDPDAVADSICEVCVQCFGFEGVAVSFARPPRQEFELIRSAGRMPGEPSRRHVLTLGERPIAQLDLWTIDGLAHQGREAIDAILPWLALAIDGVCAQGAIASQSRRIQETSTERLRAESQLLQAQKMEAVGRLANSVAHDFRNFLQAITGYADMAAQRIDSTSPVSACIQEIRIAAERGSHLVQQLLSATRRRAMRPERLDLNRVVRDLQLLLERVIGDNLHLKLQLDPELAPVRADRAQIEQVIVNLVENSREASPGGGLIEIGTASAVESGSSPRSMPGDVRLWVRDEGRGMDAETRARVFEPFFTTSTSSRVSGLGLSMVYTIVTQSGGTVSIESEVGAGTMVMIELPRDESLAHEEERGVATSYVPGGETIVVVEDDPQVRSLARQTLEAIGYRVIDAGNAIEALEQVEPLTTPLALLVTDVVMPDMDGRALAHQVLRKRPELKGVIYVSGYSYDDLGVYTALPGQVAFLRKPFPMTRLVTEVRRALS
jgi:signal transduction histidine kinase